MRRLSRHTLMTRTIKIYRDLTPLPAETWQHGFQINCNSMAAPIAYEEPSIQKAWEAFRAHLPTMLWIWAAYILFSGLGMGLSWIMRSISESMPGIIGGGETGKAVAVGIGQLVQMPFILVSSLIYVLFLSVPAQYYKTGEAITPMQAFSQLLNDPLRYLLAGFLFVLLMTIGFVLCIIPGLLIGFVMPVYVHRIFLTKQSIPDAFAGSFQAVYRSPNGLPFVGIQVLAGLLMVIFSVCTCGVGAIAALPMSNFYVFNYAYHKGLIS